MSHLSISLPSPSKISELRLILQIKNLDYFPTYLPGVARTLPG